MEEVGIYADQLESGRSQTGLATQIRIRVITYIRFHFVGDDVIVISELRIIR